MGLHRPVLYKASWYPVDGSTQYNNRRERSQYWPPGGQECNIILQQLYNSAGMASIPRAFPVGSCLIAFLTSSSLGGLSRSVFVATCGRRTIASALISAALLRTVSYI